MPGPAPKPNRRGRNKLARGDMQSSDAMGWQYGATPEPPDGLFEVSREAWALWFASWFAAHWRPEDVPVLRQTIRLYDEIERGLTKRSTDRAQLHIWMRAYGITPDGQLALRWARPKPNEESKSSPSQRQPAIASPYGHLKVVND